MSNYWAKLQIVVLVNRVLQFQQFTTGVAHFASLCFNQTQNLTHLINLLYWHKCFYRLNKLWNKPNHERGCPCGVMVKSVGLRNRRMQVRTAVVLLCSLSGKYPWERYKPAYPPSYGSNSTTTVLLKKGWIWHLIVQEGWHAIKITKTKPCFLQEYHIILLKNMKSAISQNSQALVWAHNLLILDTFSSPRNTDQTTSSKNHSNTMSIPLMQKSTKWFR